MSNTKTEQEKLKVKIIEQFKQQVYSNFADEPGGMNI